MNMKLIDIKAMKEILPEEHFKAVVEKLGLNDQYVVMATHISISDLNKAINGENDAHLGFDAYIGPVNNEEFISAMVDGTGKFIAEHLAKNLLKAKHVVSCQYENCVEARATKDYEKMLKDITDLGFSFE